MTDLRARFGRHVRDAGLFPESGTALLAVSGGVDSVAMLDLMAQAASGLGLALVVGHVDHGIRPDSNRVATAVRTLAERHGVRFVSVRLDLGPDSSETEARRERYRALRRLQREMGARYLVTAHQADDQAETVLFRFIRGSGVAGLAGIPARAAEGLVRPLLPFDRAELTAWVEERGLPVDDDPANADPRHDRSWLRATLLPELRVRFGEAVDARLRAVAADAERNREAWSRLLAAVPGLVTYWDADRIEVARVPLARYHKALSQALLRACALEVGCRVGPRQAERLHDFASTGQSGKGMDLGSRWRAELAFDRLQLVRCEAIDEHPSAYRIVGERGEVQFGEWRIRWRPSHAGAIQRRGSVTWFPPGELVVRPWHPGDRMVPYGGVGRRKVCRVLMEGRVPMRERGAYPVVERDGAVVWVPGLCRAADALPKTGALAWELEAVGGTPSLRADTTHAG